MGGWKYETMRARNTESNRWHVFALFLCVSVSNKSLRNTSNRKWASVGRIANYCFGLIILSARLNALFTSALSNTRFM
uniref:Uncharacterized protein n=1 Tax=Wuchereria bancrofti TaxID=6293 RepID=A0AAF5PPC6_WUCBA